MSQQFPIFSAWVNSTTTPVRIHEKVLLHERSGQRAVILPTLFQLAREHYVAPAITAARIANLGALKTAALLREELPTRKRSRSGDFGEILATEYVDEEMDFDVPIRRLQWKDGREMALRGDDIIGIAQDGDEGRLRILKGEAKSRAWLSPSVIDEAAKALNRNRDRPSRHAVLFVAKRLREHGKDDAATELEKAVLVGFRGTKIEHLLFAFCGNDPDACLSGYLKAHKKWKRKRHAVGLQVKDHGNFIRKLYKGI